jgi:hypothetical protein
VATHKEARLGLLSPALAQWPLPNAVAVDLPPEQWQWILPQLGSLQLLPRLGGDGSKAAAGNLLTLLID